MGPGQRWPGPQEIDESMTGPLLVTDFDTEENHDILTVNGKATPCAMGSGLETPQPDSLNPWNSVELEIE